MKIRLTALACLALALTMVWLAFGATQIELASIANQRLSSSPADEAGFSAVQSRLDRAGLWKHSSDWHYLSGQLAQKRAETGPQQDQLSLLNTALAHYRRATELRPLWPDNWAAIVEVKLLLSEDDAEFHTALHRTLQYGPNESRLFMALFPMLRLHWFWLNESEKTSILAFTSRAAWREPAWVVNIAARYDYLTELCDHIGPNKLARQHCDRALEKEQGQSL